jgi:hypothetical protein
MSRKSLRRRLDDLTVSLHATVKLRELAEKINEHHRAGEQQLASCLEQYKSAGERLIEAKKLVRHGQWEEWLESKVGISRKTASAYMRLVRRWDEIQDAIVQRAGQLSFREAIRLIEHKEQADLSHLQTDAFEAEAQAAATRIKLAKRERAMTNINRKVPFEVDTALGEIREMIENYSPNEAEAARGIAALDVIERHVHPALQKEDGASLVDDEAAERAFEADERAWAAAIASLLGDD